MAKRKDKHPKVRPVIVRWIDSASEAGWGVKPGNRLKCVTVGIRVKGPKDRISIVQSRSHYSDGEMIEIPKIAVASIRRLKE